MSKRIVKSKALALKITNYSNTSQITQFLTRDFGKIGILAKGSRNPKSKISGVLQTLSHYEIVFYHKEESLSILKEIEVIDDNYELSQSYKKNIVAQAAAEIYLQLMFEENDYKKFYELLINYFDYLKKVEKNHIIVFWRFFLRVAQYLGFNLRFENCEFCGKEKLDLMHGITFSNNGFVCKKCARKMPYQENFQCSKKTIKLLASINNISDKLETIKLSKKTIQSINSILKNYLSYHLHKNIHLKSLALLS